VEGKAPGIVEWWEMKRRLDEKRLEAATDKWLENFTLQEREVIFSKLKKAK